MLKQLNTQTSNPMFAAALVDFLLRNNLLGEAEPEIARLAKLEPNSLRTLTLKSQWRRAAQHPLDEISREIDEHRQQAAASSNDSAEKVRVQASYAMLYTKLDMKPQAEAVYRQMLREQPGHRTLQYFVVWLSNEGRLKDAVQVCLDVTPADEESGRSVQILANVLTWCAARGESYPKAEERLAALVAAQKEDASLLLDLGTLRHMQGRTRDAEALYQRAIKLQPTNALIRNNLAMLLMEQPDTAQQALFEIELAIQSVGSAPELRDTYALVLARTGRARDAKRILQSLVTQAPRVSRYQFHLAVIEHQLANKPEAERWLASAKKNHLAEELMTPVERAMLLDLEKSLSSPGSVSPNNKPPDALGSNRGS